MAYPAPPLSAREARNGALKSAGSRQVGTVPALGNTSRPTNILLVRDDVGKSKPTCFDLPEDHFSYGRPGNTDVEGAREVSMRWVSHTPSRSVEAEALDFVSLNRKAAIAKITTAKDIRTYSKATPRGGSLSARGSSAPGKPIIPSDVIPGFSYGRKVRPSTPINEVISARFAESSEKQLGQFYSEMKELREASRSQVRKIPLTTATKLHANAVRKVVAEEAIPKEPFKLSKFKRVGPRVTSFRQKSDAAEAMEADALLQTETIEAKLQRPQAEILSGSALAEDMGTYAGY
eukprot:TRINITY_DN6904_c0_g1_i1.p1 TRINITY_DN6904_c0_g1~~TRINITY_DN6904_c0_g1_i1.p1  ORF type:complete len:291 (+),score=56.56 TRINITY_DN6904_c0_g1_i1:68-940(+)